MILNETKCISYVDECIRLVKFGKTKYGIQKYICKSRKKIRVKNYIYQAYNSDIKRNSIQLQKNSSTSYLKN